MTLTCFAYNYFIIVIHSWIFKVQRLKARDEWSSARKKRNFEKGFLYYHGKFELNWCDNVSSEIMQAIFFSTQHTVSICLLLILKRLTQLRNIWTSLMMIMMPFSISDCIVLIVGAHLSFWIIAAATTWIPTYVHCKFLHTPNILLWN